VGERPCSLEFPSDSRGLEPRGECRTRSRDVHRPLARLGQELRVAELHSLIIRGVAQGRHWAPEQSLCLQPIARRCVHCIGRVGLRGEDWTLRGLGLDHIDVEAADLEESMSSAVRRGELPVALGLALERLTPLLLKTDQEPARPFLHRLGQVGVLDP